MASAIVISALLGSGQLLLISLASLFIVPYVLIMADVVGERTIERNNGETYKLVSLIVSGVLYLLIVVGVFAEASSLLIISAFLIFLIPFLLNMIWPRR